MDFIRRRRLSVFGHIARLTQGTPAHNALHCQVGLASGHSLGRDWRRRPGRPRARWTDQLRNDTGSVPANLWRQAILWGRGGATRRPELATRWRRRRRRRIQLSWKVWRRCCCIFFQQTLSLDHERSVWRPWTIPVTMTGKMIETGTKLCRSFWAFLHVIYCIIIIIIKLYVCIINWKIRVWCCLGTW